MLSEIEIFDKAQAEKDKGNEAFKAGIIICFIY